METNRHPSTLNGQRVIILGGSSGLGLATARAAASEGAEVVIVSGHPGRMEAALKTLPGSCAGHTVDLRREENIRSFFAGIGPFDHLVYTAGENLRLAKVDDLDLQGAAGFFTLRFWGALAAIKYSAPLIREGGSISLTSGIASRRPGAGWAMGAAICGAMEGLTRAMAVELAPLRVNAVVPGVIRTSLWDSMSAAERAQFYRSVGDALLLKRVGRPEEIAQTFLFLMKQSFATGQTYTVDGGALLV